MVTIDIERDVFDTLSDFLRNEYSTISIYGEYIRSPAVFPCVIIEEKDNYVIERTQTGNEIENHAGVMYEINVFSNKQTGKKAQCKEIISKIDQKMKEIGFTRTMLNSVLNLEDATIYRMVGRYKAVVASNGTIFRR